MPVRNLRELFVHELRDTYNAEKQNLRALPKMIRNAETEELRNALQQHVEVTHAQVERLDQIFESLGISAGRVKCHGMEGLIEEGLELIDEAEGVALDAGMIGAAQKIEHYEIAAYGTLRTMAQLLGESDAQKLLQATLDEEKDMDKRLNAIAEAINPQAAEEDEEEEEVQENTRPNRSSKGKAARGRS